MPYTYTVLHGEQPIAKAESERFDEARQKALDEVPAGIARDELEHETIDCYGKLLSGPCFYPFH